MKKTSSFINIVGFISSTVTIIDVLNIIKVDKGVIYICNIITFLVIFFFLVSNFIKNTTFKD